MKKAKIILFALALIAILSISIAFKTSKYTGAGQAFIFTDAYTTFGTVYKLAPGVSTYLPVNPIRFFTNTGIMPTTLYSTTFVVTCGGIPCTTTLTRLGGTQTITFSVYFGIHLHDTFTTAFN